jgi:Predicted membrane protein (DUF2127)
LGALYIPIEIGHLMHRTTLVNGAVLLVNVLMVGVLAFQLWHRLKKTLEAPQQRDDNNEQILIGARAFELNSGDKLWLEREKGSRHKPKHPSQLAYAGSAPISAGSGVAGPMEARMPSRLSTSVGLTR